MDGDPEFDHVPIDDHENRSARVARAFAAAAPEMGQRWGCSPWELIIAMANACGIIMAETTKTDPVPPQEKMDELAAMVGRLIAGTYRENLRRKLEVEKETTTL